MQPTSIPPLRAVPAAPSPVRTDSPGSATGPRVASPLRLAAASLVLALLAPAAASAGTYAPTETPARGAGTGGDAFYPTPAGLDSARLVLPRDLRYLGAFRLDRDRGDTKYGFSYLVGAMTHYPKGDPKGPADGFPGSLFIGGHTSERKVAEVAIPKPVKSREYRDLPEARRLTPFRDLGVLEGGSGVVVMDIAWLPAQEGQDRDRLHVTLADGYLPKEGIRTYVMSDPDFTRQTAPRVFAPDRVHCYNDYLFAVPKAWADRYAPGMNLAVGRHREGDLCGQGPALFVTAPWKDTASPRVATRTLLRYKEKGGAVVSYSHGGDVFYAGHWLEAGRKSAVIFSGRKGLGQGAYGTHCNVQGFHDLKGYRPYILFYDPEELGRVAQGALPSHAPQPYAGVDVNDLLLWPNSEPCHRQHLSDFAYDAAGRILYASEKSKGEYPVIHAWRVGG